MMRDRRRIVTDQIVRIRPDYHDRYGGLWLVVREIDDDYITGTILMEDEDQTIIRLPRVGVEVADRVFIQSSKN